ncbi:group XIIB secretory phospholipase A2-like protein [Eurytemora carolleeae]|uniref:group XIIB secretory phospholipase A2-like protein n=1 Tax=Eurytemora carolleeae TaxID=1294199 RepID=UPI000C784EB9|nr:group XIIB secretory phospholipase A2-like protein [Eurytemora carolleeae]|eukprot:XP_023323403.1 group XIIB secretory phospholipase A2-like protein [Eurytemora affinis]
MKILILTLIVSFQGGSAFMEDVKTALNSARGYLDEILPMISNGIKAVQKFEEFVENSIEEDCYYECPKGNTKTPKPDHVQTANGCGSLDITFDDSNESFIYVEKEFSDCCHSHDYCYDTCGEDKDFCDVKFRKCLYKVCSGEEHKKFLDNKKCKLKAKLFYMTVVGVGCQPFKDAQRNACDCVKGAAKGKTEL